MAATPHPPKVPYTTVTIHGGYGNRVLTHFTFGELVNKVEDTPFMLLAGRSREDYIPPIYSSIKLVPECRNTFTIRNLINWLFPKCEYCEKRYLRYLFKFHYKDVHICKKCCWIYDIDSVDKYNIVNEIRNKIKKDISLKSYWDDQYAENESKEDRLKAIMS